MNLTAIFNPKGGIFMTMSMIVFAVPFDEHRLAVEFGGGSFLILDMRHRMQTTRHYNLSEPSIFRGAYTDGSKIIFDPDSVFVPDIFPQEAVNMALRALPFDVISFVKVRPERNRRIRLEMATGSIIIINMENHVSTERYRPLNDHDMFASVRADRESLIFGTAAQDNVLRIDEDELTRLMLSIPI